MATYVYTRQSIDLAEGIDRQRERCLRLCSDLGWEVAEVFEDNAVSATKTRGVGTAWSRMVEVLQPDDVVVAVDVDRIMRSLKDLLVLQDRGARIYTLSGEIDTTTADGQFRGAMLAAIAAFETKRKGERQIRANEARSAKGKPVPGKRRYGFETDGVTPREPEAAVVRRMFQEVAAGRSLRAVVAGLEADGIKPNVKEPVNGESVEPSDKAWSRRRLREMLMNPAYVGKVVHRGVTLPSEHVVPLVSEDVWERVQAVLTAEDRQTGPGPKAKSLLSGILVCAECGQAMRMRKTAYVCPAEHNNVQVHTAEAVVRAVAVMVATSFVLPADAGMATAGHLAELNAALSANDTEALAVSQDRQDGLLSAAAARERLLALRDERQGLEAQVDAARAVTGDLLVWAEAARAVNGEAGFDALDLEAARAVVRGVAEWRVQRAQRRGRAVQGEWRIEFKERGGERWNRARMDGGKLSWETLSRWAATDPLGN